MLAFFSGRADRTPTRLYVYACMHAPSHATAPRAFPRYCCTALLFHRCCTCPVVMLPAIESRHGSHHVAFRLFFFFFCGTCVAHVHTSSVNRRRDVSAFSRPNVRAHAHARNHARTRWIFTRYRHFFFTRPSGRDFVGPPHILDSAVLISELWAHRGNSHSKNGFFRPSGAVMER